MKKAIFIALAIMVFLMVGFMAAAQVPQRFNKVIVTGDITSPKFIKTNSNNDSVLLGGGSAKSVVSFKTDTASLSNRINTKEPLLPSTPTSPETKWLNGNRQWAEMVMGSGGYASNVYFTNLTSTINGAYKQTSGIADVAETIVSGTCNNNEVLIYTYLFELPVGITMVDAGVWRFTMNSVISSNVGDSKFKIVQFRRSSTGVETDMFTIYSNTIENIEYQNNIIETVQPSFIVDSLDRFGCRIYATTTTTVNKTMSYKVGDGFASYINTPLALGHNQLRRLNVDPNNKHVTTTQIDTWTNTSNTNTGDETLTSIKTKLGAATSVSDGYLKYQDFVNFDGKLSSEIDGSTTNELNNSMYWDNTTNTVSVADAGGTKSVIITGFLESEVDGSVTNEIQTPTLVGNSIGLSLTGATIDVSQADAVQANTAKISNATHTGDATGSTALTLATVNSNVGTFNNITINAKGLATAGSNVSYQAPLTIGNLTSTTSGVTIGNGTGAVIGSGVTVNIATAGASADGILTSGHWNTFNSKEPAFSKNSGFNLSLGTTTGTVLEGRTFGTAANSSVGDFQPIENQRLSTTNAPTFGSLQLNTTGRSEGISVRMTSGSADAGLFYTSELSAGTSNGVRILAGTTASDYALNVNSQAGTSLFKVDGEGTTFMPNLQRYSDAINVNLQSISRDLCLNPDGNIVKIPSTYPSSSPTSGTLVVGGGVGADHVRANNFYGVFIGNASTATNVAYSGLTGTVPTWNQNTTGSSATLTTSRTIWGQSFNGSGNVSGAISGATTGDFSGTVTASSFNGSGSNLTGVQLPITLTTTGTSGVATFSGNTLNIPNYGSAATSGSYTTTLANQVNISSSSAGGMIYTHTGSVYTLSVSGSITPTASGSCTLYLSIPAGMASASGTFVSSATNSTGSATYSSYVSTGGLGSTNLTLIIEAPSTNPIAFYLTGSYMHQ